MSTREKERIKLLKHSIVVARGQHVFQSDITKGMAKNQQLTTGVCAACLSLEGLKDVFNSLFNWSRVETTQKIRLKTRTIYYDLTKQNDFLI